MIKQLQNNLIENIQKIIQVSLDDFETILPILESTIQEVTEYNAKVLALKPYHQSRKINVDFKNDEFGVNLGIKRTKTNLVIQKWLFELQQRIKGYILTFIVIKESFMLFLEHELIELEEAIINIVSMLMIKQLYKIKTFDNPIIASVIGRIYPNTISGIEYQRIDSLFKTLFQKKVPYNDVFTTFFKDRKEQKPDANELYNKFSKWTNSFLKDDDIISPIYVREKIVPIIDSLLELGYEKGTSSVIAKMLNVHENTARNYFKEMTTNYTTFWRALVNYERLKLHNYLFIITVKDQTKFEQIHDLLWKIPYLKSLYIGESEGQKLLYSPSLICPHLVSEQLNEQLRKFEAKEILEYTLQLIRGRYHFGTITSKYLTPSMKTFTELLDNSKSTKSLKKYTFAEEIRDSSLVFNDDDIPFDYNLLYFLSILSSKFLLKSRYGVNVSQLPKLYEKNDIPKANVDSQTDFINQIEIRARRRNLLSYALFMRGQAPKTSNVLIFEIHTIDLSDEKLQKLIERLSIFS
ncbi:MAG: hypothetical protein ACTSO7_17710, partial [Candidatus Heimdallarchaeota archaeon]